MGLFAELKRRNVIRMALLYGVASWVVLQVADVLFGIMGVPDWSLRLVFGILLLGLPVALVFAWVFELTPEGLRRERPADEALARPPDTGRKMDATITALLVVAVALLLLERVLPRPEAVISAAPVAVPPAAVPSEAVGRPAAGVDAPAPPPAAGASVDAPGAADPRSLAVLPFVNMSGDADNEYFSDGLTEELLNVLAQVEGLRVAARTSSFRFKNEVGDMADIARQLRVAHLLEGSVRRSGDRVRITAQLISAADGFHLWSETYDRQLTDIFAIQDDIAAEVAQALRVRLLGEAMPTVARPPTGDLAAYTAYLRGRQALRSSGYAAFERADAAFREALALDPDFAAAHAALAETWRQRALWGIVPWSEARKHVREGVERALALDPDQPLAWMLDGSLQWEDLDPEASWIDTMDAAERSYRRALELEPGQPQASASLANLLRMRGRDDEALGLVLDALARDPLSAQAHLAVGNHYQSSGQLEQAGARYLAAVELAPEDPRPAQVLSQLRYEQARIGEAIVLRVAALPLDPRDHEGPLVLVRYYLELGMTEDALPWLEAAERMAPEATTSQLVRAMWHWRHGERARAADLSAAALAAELPERWSSEIRFPIMVAMHELASGGYQRSLELILAEVPTALDPPAPDEPVTSFAFFQKLRSLVILRLRDGEAAARARALELQALVQRQADSIPPEPLSFARLYLHGALGEADEFVAVWRSIDRGRYALDNWFWTESDLHFLTERDAPAVRALLAEQEAVRARERAWLAVPGRMPDPEAVLAEMARAAAHTPDRALPRLPDPEAESQRGPR
jgi:TolB-like protein/Tfp pilus assembly protein PilF